jgi:NitT/TauT family transport system substrate-binding protein
MRRRFRGLISIGIALIGACTLHACLGGQRTNSNELRLGYFPNLTHATALAGVEKSLFEEKLGGRATFKTFAFNSGPQAVEAVFSSAIDATYIGPSPAVNAFVRSRGKAARIVAGATSGGASLVVAPEISSPSDLRGKKLATPQLGNTQDVALRTWLANQGLKTDVRGGGDVSVVNQASAEALESFRSGAVSGAWLPEPWASRLIIEGKGKSLVNEAELWPDGRFATTLLLVRKDFLDDRRPLVRALVEGHLAATSFVNADANEAKRTVNHRLEKMTGKALADGVINMAWDNLTFTYDPVASSVRTSAANAKKLRLLDDADLDGIFDMSILNELLTTSGTNPIALP